MLLRCKCNFSCVSYIWAAYYVVELKSQAKDFAKLDISKLLDQTCSCLRWRAVPIRVPYLPYRVSIRPRKEVIEESDLPSSSRFKIAINKFNTTHIGPLFAVMSLPVKLGVGSDLDIPNLSFWVHILQIALFDNETRLSTVCTLQMQLHACCSDNEQGEKNRRIFITWHGM